METPVEQPTSAKFGERTREEIFQSIVNRIKLQDATLSDAEARQAAQHLIEFVKEVMRVYNGR